MYKTILLFVVGILFVAQFFIVGEIKEKWWKHATFYQIYPRSFKDSNNDGTGDLKGITEKLYHLKDAGVDAFWISPFYPSPGIDAGYDISNYTDIDPIFGKIEDFEDLLEKAKTLGLKLIIDFVPNHSSDQHEWFKKSESREPGYENYYVWLDGKANNTQPPNNWISKFHGSAWNFSEKRKQWYLHQYAKQQPDLNYRCPKVVEEVKKILTFWLDKGVDGFRVDAINKLFEKEGYPDEPLSNNAQFTSNDYGFLKHIYTLDQPGTFDMVYQWREHLNNYVKENGGDEKILITEAYSKIEQIQYYFGNDTHEGAHVSFNFLFITDIKIDSNAHTYKDTIDKWFEFVPSKYTPNWLWGNHDQIRLATKFGSDRVDGLIMLQMFLPGAAVTYQGEEIGMENGDISWEQVRDPKALNGKPENYIKNSREFQRTPFQWDNSVNAGFNEGFKTWLPVGKAYNVTNLAAQNVPGVKSHYNIYKKLMALRKTEMFKNGELKTVTLSDNVLFLTRKLADDKETYILIINLSNKEETVNLNSLLSNRKYLQIILTSTKSTKEIGDIVKISNIQLSPYESVLLTTSVNIKEEHHYFFIFSVGFVVITIITVLTLIILTNNKDLQHYLKLVNME